MFMDEIEKILNIEFSPSLKSKLNKFYLFKI